MNITINLRGLEDVQRRLERLARADTHTRAIARAIFRRENLILTPAKRDCPVDKGTLRASGTAFIPEIRGGRVTGTVGFGGPAGSYALAVHERHATKSKFLERNFNAQSDELPADIAAELQKGVSDIARS